MENIDFDSMGIDFFEPEHDLIELERMYKIIVADDDEEVHTITEMALQSFKFENRKLEIIHTYSGKETIDVMKEHSDSAILLLDVVMEETKSGLFVVEHIRNVMNNRHTRIVLRTGQPGEAPREEVINEYEINDYLLKTELTVQKLYATLFTALRSFRDITELSNHKRGLEKVLETSSDLYKHDSYGEFLNSILRETTNFCTISKCPDENILLNSFIAVEKYKKTTIVAATGYYESFIDKNLHEIEELSIIDDFISDESNKHDKELTIINDGIMVKSANSKQLMNYIFIECDVKRYDLNLVKLFLNNYSLVLDNHIMGNTITSTQREMIFTLSEVIENHFEENSLHVRRISEMMFNFAKLNGYTHIECELIKLASTMHDVGKIGIPDEILKKPAKLTMEEFIKIKEHTTIGHEILSKSELDALTVAAEIALYHHEKYDGTGYPSGISGNFIPLTARMLAILDVFDALTHKRVYKDAISVDEANEYIIKNAGTHFDPKLVEIFISNQKQITMF